jgi:hypothetical protein
VIVSQGWAIARAPDGPEEPFLYTRVTITVAVAISVQARQSARALGLVEVD